MSPAAGVFSAACGLRWAPTEADRLEYTENLNKIRYEVRCATCNAAFARRAAEPEA
jgi:peptide subunit release factor 1 (eRF1)